MQFSEKVFAKDKNAAATTTTVQRQSEEEKTFAANNIEKEYLQMEEVQLNMFE